ncbi:MAG: tungstate ABC transporter substrate-binding protein WtpA [Methanosarcinales archaeon]|nr:MAG: tungstate ABC transporter substrate-binding protein WtpA [Methanosarcinales archaeon]
MKATPIVVLVLIIAVIVAAIFLPDTTEKTELLVVHAGSLIIPFAEMEKQFESQNPGVDVRMEGHGSIQAIRQVTDIHRQVDVLVVADENLIPDMMYPAYADWHVRFATNRMVLAYTNRSRYAGVINGSNWHEILMRPEVTFGFSNPMLDACGYRTLMVAQLAESYYGNQTIFRNLIACNFNPTFSVVRDGDTATVVVPEILDPRAKKVVIRGGSVQLLALLELGEIDYIFEYRSVSEQHGLRFVKLPPEIDLSTPDNEAMYENVGVDLGFRRFTSVGTRRTGKPIFYAITIPKDAPHPKLAMEFMEFVTSEEGRRVLQAMGQPTVPPIADNPDKMPAGLRGADE